MVGGLRFPHSPLEGDGFELSVPRQRRHPSATANRLSRHHFREISACASHQRLRPLRGNPPSFPGKSPVPRKGPRSTPPGPAGACISENARASKRQLVPSRTSVGSRGAKHKPGLDRFRNGVWFRLIDVCGEFCLEVCRQLREYRYPAEVMSQEPHSFGAGPPFDVIRFGLLEQPLPGLTSIRVLQMPGRVRLVTERAWCRRETVWADRR